MKWWCVRMTMMMIIMIRVANVTNWRKQETSSWWSSHLNAEQDWVKKRERGEYWKWDNFRNHVVVCFSFQEHPSLPPSLFYFTACSSCMRWCFNSWFHFHHFITSCRLLFILFTQHIIVLIFMQLDENEESKNYVDERWEKWRGGKKKRDVMLKTRGKGWGFPKRNQIFVSGAFLSSFPSFPSLTSYGSPYLIWWHILHPFNHNQRIFTNFSSSSKRSGDVEKERSDSDIQRRVIKCSNGSENGRDEDEELFFMMHAKNRPSERAFFVTVVILMS